MKRIAVVALALRSLLGAADPHSVTLTWEDTKNPAGSVTYRIYRTNGLCAGLPPITGLTPIAIDISAKTYVDNTVVPGNYCYRATSYLASGSQPPLESLPSDPALAAVPSWEPSDLSVTSVTSDTVSLTWKDLKNPAGALYNVYRAPGLCSGTPTFAKIATALTGLSYQDLGIAPGHYCYRISATDNGVESAQGSSVLASVPTWTPQRLSVIVK